MSLKLNERYPGRYNNPSAGYPQGSFKNRTTPTAKDGSYLEQDWANDKEGFFQSLLSIAGVEPNGLVDSVGASQFFDALLHLGQNQAGQAFAAAGVAPAFTLTPSPAITAYVAGQRFRIKFNAAAPTSGSLNVSGLGDKSLKQYGPAGTKITAVIASGQLADVEYDGTDWVLLDPLPAPSTLPPGAIMGFSGNVAPADWLKANGAAVSRTTYAALFSALVTAAGFTPQTFTTTIASPGVSTKTAHGFAGGERLRLFTTGALPTGLTTTADYFVEVINANTYYLLNAPGGTRIVTTGTQSGVHSYLQSWFGPGDGSTTFNLPDLRAEVIRGWDDSRGIDVARAFGSLQLDAFQGHWHAMAYNALATIGTGGNSYVQQTVSGNNAGTVNDTIRAPISDGTNGTPRVTNETRARNVALLHCIKI